MTNQGAINSEILKQVREQASELRTLRRHVDLLRTQMEALEALFTAL